MSSILTACQGTLGNKLLFTVEPLGELPGSAMDELAAEVERMAPFRGAATGELRMATL